MRTHTCAHAYSRHDGQVNTKPCTHATPHTQHSKTTQACFKVHSMVREHTHACLTSCYVPALPRARYVPRRALHLASSANLVSST
mmetsp:Transcript_1663/g.3714  ORF Transcript_1663/g.3714 Transcript_1663/m.3714 type:complete len:85 (+) Transcript_1663:1-255(+)